MKKVRLGIILIIINYIALSLGSEIDKKLIVLTVAEEEKLTDRLEQYLKSARFNQLEVKVLDVNSGSYDPDLLLTGTVGVLWEELQANYDTEVILFTPSQNTLLLGQSKEILDRFLNFKVDLLFSTESLALLCPNKKSNETIKILNSFIGYKSTIIHFLGNLKNPSSQLNYCDPDTDTGTREKIKIDFNLILFNTLKTTDFGPRVELVCEPLKTTLRDSVSHEKVLIIQGGNARGQVALNYYANYLLDWTLQTGCRACEENTISLAELNDKTLPVVTIGIFIARPTPFLEEFLEKIRDLDYPKKKINLFIYNNVTYHNKLVSNYLTSYTRYYSLIKTITPSDTVQEKEARNLAVDFARRWNSDYFLSIDSIAHLDNPSTLKKLIEQNRGIVAPLLRRPNKLTSNFWTASDLKGFYDKSKDYVQILKGKWRGLWNVECLSNAYLVNRIIFQDDLKRPNYVSKIPNVDWAFCRHNIKVGNFMYVSNRLDWGHLVNPDGFDEKIKYRIHSELVEFFTNQLDWENRYIHPDWPKALANASPFSPQLCPDVYTFPILSVRFCEHVIEELDNYGNWSEANDYDFDPAPTRDIGLDQIGFLSQWHHFIKIYIQPLQEKLYPGYKRRPLNISTPFVIRYQPDGRKILNAHHDLSTYTINIALNTVGKDFEGGGVHFTRYNCSVTDCPMGWLLIHPGQLTHEHRGLIVTNGTRYVLISFVDPH